MINIKNASKNYEKIRFKNFVQKYDDDESIILTISVFPSSSFDIFHGIGVYDVLYTLRPLCTSFAYCF